MAHSARSPLVPLAELVQGECRCPPIKPQKVNQDVVVVCNISEGANDLLHNADPGHVLAGLLNIRHYLLLPGAKFYVPRMQSFLNPYLKVLYQAPLTWLNYASLLYQMGIFYLGDLSQSNS